MMLEYNGEQILAYTYTHARTRPPTRSVSFKYDNKFEIKSMAIKTKLKQNLRATIYYHKERKQKQKYAITKGRQMNDFH